MADAIAKSRERFVREIAEHQMDVLRDDGLYRHLRFKRPGTSNYYFDIVTWPGYLAVVGDCGDFVFSRTRDMFEFFGPSGARGGFEDARWGINPHYWSKKLQAPRPDGAEVYSADAARACVLEWLVDRADGMHAWDEFDEAGPCGGRAAFELYQALREQILDHDLYSEDEARRLIEDFEHNDDRIYDAWEWSFREYDWQFLWCCWAIVWGIEQYRARVASDAVAA